MRLIHNASDPGARPHPHIRVRGPAHVAAAAAPERVLVLRGAVLLPREQRRDGGVLFWGSESAGGSSFVLWLLGRGFLQSTS